MRVLLNLYTPSRWDGYTTWEYAVGDETVANLIANSRWYNVPAGIRSELAIRFLRRCTWRMTKYINLFVAEVSDEVGEVLRLLGECKALRKYRKSGWKALTTRQLLDELRAIEVAQGLKEP